MDTTVARSSLSVMVCRMWATHSHPALVVKAYWKGAVAFSTCFATCFEIVLATRRLIMSPTTIPLTPPSGLVKAVNRPNPIPAMASSGITPCAMIEATVANNSESASLSKIGNKWSAVMPEGPPAAPLLEVRKEMRNNALSNSKGSAGLELATSGLISWRGCANLRSGLVNSRNVAKVPGDHL